MNLLKIALGNAIQKVRLLEAKRQKFGKMLRSTSLSHKSFLEDNLIYKISSSKVTGKVAGVDGGLVQKNFHGLDLILRKAICVVFNYHKSRLLDVEYLPTPFPNLQPVLVSRPFTSLDITTFAGIKRQTLEVEVALQAVNNLDIDWLLMDGSLVPHPNMFPIPTSEVWSEFHNLLNKIKDLFDACKKKNIPLIGVVEDSRARRFTQILGKALSSNLQDMSVINNSTDTNLLYYVLEPGERTCMFPYQDDCSHNAASMCIRDVCSFYVRSAAYDRPLRIDYLASISTPNKVASIVYALSGNDVYSIPSPLIEADARAKLTNNEIEMIYNQFIDEVGELPMILKLRRDLRPF
jgi:hypothetical protein